MTKKLSLRKPISILLALLMVLALLPTLAIPAFAANTWTWNNVDGGFAADGSSAFTVTAGDTVNITNAAASGELDLSLVDGTVTITSSGLIDLDSGITINLGTGATVNWNATVTSADSTTVTLIGNADQKFNVLGGSIANSVGGGIAIAHGDSFNPAVTVNVSGGTVTASGSSGIAIKSYDSTLNVTSGSVSATGTGGTAIRLEGSVSIANISGGTVNTDSGTAIFVADGCFARITGGKVNVTGGGTVFGASEGDILLDDDSYAPGDKGVGSGSSLVVIDNCIVEDKGTAKGSTISATYNGLDVVLGRTRVVLGGRLDITVTGHGAVDYEFVWTVDGSPPSGGAGLTVDADNPNKAEATYSHSVTYKCTVTGTGRPSGSYDYDPPAPRTGTFSLLKTDEADKPLAGAVFQLASPTPGVSGFTATSNASGVVNFTAPVGYEYELKELTAPDGYIKSDDVYHIKISSGGAVSIVDRASPNGRTYSTITVVNKKAGFTLLKTDDKGTPLAGAVFQLVELNATEPAYEATSGADGIVTFSKAAEGQYTLSEQSAPAGYTKSNVTYSIAVDEKGEVILFDESAPNGKPYSRITVVNSAGTNFRFLKTDDSGIPLAGAVFELAWRSTGGTQFLNATSGADGVVSFTVPEGNQYTLSEKSAPDGYYKSEETYIIYTNESGEVFIIDDESPNGRPYDLITYVNYTDETDDDDDDWGQGSRPTPSSPNRTVIPGVNGTYIEIDEGDTPLGEWHWNESTGEWVFDKYPTPLGDLPATGDGAPANPIIMIMQGVLLTVFVAGCVHLIKKRKLDDSDVK